VAPLGVEEFLQFHQPFQVVVQEFLAFILGEATVLLSGHLVEPHARVWLDAVMIGVLHNGIPPAPKLKADR
jgi:hypothetical protein